MNKKQIKKTGQKKIEQEKTEQEKNFLKLLKNKKIFNNLGLFINEIRNKKINLLNLKINVDELDILLKKGYIDIFNKIFEGIVKREGKNIKKFINGGLKGTGFTLLHKSCIYGYFDICKLLIKKGIDVNHNDNNFKTTSLHLAVKNGYFDICKLLIKNGADVTIKDNNKKTILHISFLNNKDTKITKYLIKEYEKKGLNFTKLVNKCNNDYFLSFVDIALGKGNFELIKILQEYGIKIKIDKNDYQSLFYRNIYYGSFGVVKIILDKMKKDGLNVKKMINNYMTIDEKPNIFTLVYPIYYSIKKGNLEIVKLLVENGADLNIGNKYGWEKLRATAFFNCYNRKEVKGPLLSLIKNEKIFNYLINNGIDINYKNKFGETNLYMALKNGNFKAFDYFIKNGANVDTIDCDGESILMLAIKEGKTKIGKVLLDKNVKIDNIVKNGFNILNYLAIYNKKDIKFSKSILEKLKKETKDFKKFLNGKDKHYDSKKLSIILGNNGDPLNTPLFYAVSKGNFKFAKLLIENGADVNCENYKGNTPIFYANDERQFKSNFEFIKLLVENGADINHKNQEGETIFDNFSGYRLDNFKKYLKENGIFTSKVIKKSDVLNEIVKITGKKNIKINNDKKTIIIYGEENIKSVIKLLNKYKISSK